eukprot:CCRYP_013616-RA/>CCRYP_013616-RA protein AED:0.00 eAED:0.00 QI:33/1/1/1/0/0/2/96/31
MPNRTCREKKLDFWRLCCTTLAQDNLHNEYC